MMTNEFTLLCETCGYVIDGLPVEGRCPECGREIRTSLPEAREGSAWQQQPRVITWLATGVHMLTRPARSFSACAIETKRANSLLHINLWAAGVILAIPPAVLAVLVTHADNKPPFALMADAFIVVTMVTIFSAVLYGVVLLLTVIEQLGLRVIGRRHRWRITPAILQVVCGHASYGWIIGAALLTSTTLLVALIPSAAWERWIGLAADWRWYLIPVAALAGLLVFETLVYIGVRRCKFANRAGPPPPAKPPADSTTSQG